MTLTDILFIISTFIYGLLPFDTICLALFRTMRSVDDTGNDDSENPLIRLAKTPYILTIAVLLTFSKGFLPLWLSSQFFYTDSLLPIIILLVIAANHMSYVFNWQEKTQVIPLYLGIYFFLDPSFSLLFLLLFIIATLLVSSISIGILGSLLTCTTLTWVYYQNIDFLIVSSTVLLLYIITHIKTISLYFKGDKLSLLKIYQSRP
ncbi:hypothetical protein DID77_03740 [Candidatus Marinamargulisbacteria bacterium SCGC AG-439-L15]|nr:hypothetical protein DID77_03740 [Candidatus Marinamargulisbacteria bacterium SCGC AG-439-L15]